MMKEAQVSLLLAEWLLRRPDAGAAEVATDGAQVQIGARAIFDVSSFLAGRGWCRESPSTGQWRGVYTRGAQALRVHSTPGLGDVVVGLGACRVRAECKGGSLAPHKTSQEYPKLREALGQLFTTSAVDPRDVLVAAVPDGERFRRLAVRWRQAPLVRQSGIRIALVAPDGAVDGLDL